MARTSLPHIGHLTIDPPLFIVCAWKCYGSVSAQSVRDLRMTPIPPCNRSNTTMRSKNVKHRIIRAILWVVLPYFVLPYHDQARYDGHIMVPGIPALSAGRTGMICERDFDPIREECFSVRP
jgi:hypothetical protein